MIQPILLGMQSSALPGLRVRVCGGGGEEAVPIQPPIAARPVTVSEEINYCNIYIETPHHSHCKYIKFVLLTCCWCGPGAME